MQTLTYRNRIHQVTSLNSITIWEKDMCTHMDEKLIEWQLLERLDQDRMRIDRHIEKEDKLWPQGV